MTTTTIDARGSRHRAAGSPASTGGQYAPAVAPRQAMQLNATDRATFAQQSAAIRGAVARKFGFVVDPDEVLSTVHEVAVNKLASGDWEQLEGNWGYLRNTAMRQAITQANANLRGEERTAQVKLKEAAEQRQQKIGRELTARELELMADDIRLSFPPSRRPRIGWHQAIVAGPAESLDREIGEDGGTSVGDGLEYAQQEEQSLFDDALHLMEDNYGQATMSAEQVSLRTAPASRSTAGCSCSSRTGRLAASVLVTPGAYDAPSPEATAGVACCPYCKRCRRTAYVHAAWT
ncbi:hypothetical protein AA0Z99_00140 [Agrococcus sp. 1P02AA]|uniref:hypothetical protein n=1 Tax=Agrococcus sp. 1P02AA TaxID=3132259 RepID=UPI0039A66A63